MQKIRQLPAVEPRLETGPVQFEGDWPGVFMRGDSAGAIAMNLKSLLEGDGGADLPWHTAALLKSLQAHFASAVVGPAADLVQHSASLDSEGLPVAGKYFQHIDGGYYRLKGEVRASEDGLPRVLYEHIWPFERMDWVRPTGEWIPSRFAPVSLEAVSSAMKEDRQAAQENVKAAKARRRATGST